MKMIQTRSKKFLSIMAVFFAVLFGIMAIGCGGGGGGGTVDGDGEVIVAPGAPVLAITSSIGQGMVTSTLTWTAPTTGGEPTSYEIYRTTTAPTAENPVFQPDNHVISLSAVTFEFIENAGMEELVTTYWVVTAKNAGGETASNVVEYTPPGSGEVEGYGNNFSAAMIFADGYGISGLQLDPSKSWTTQADPLLIDYNTGLRPTSSQDLSIVPDGTLPYLDENTAFLKDGVTYYKQQTVSTWQGQWENGEDTDQNVTAKWGDNLVSQPMLTTNSVVRIEMGLTKALDTNMTTYKMEYLYGSGMNEMWGTDGTEVNTTTAFVFATNAHLIIQHVDELGNPIGDPVDDQTILDSSITDGPGKFGAEINVGGKLTYGYVWDLKKKPAPAGRYKITFKLDDTSVATGTPNNTFIDKVTNGEYVSPTEAYIIINIAQQ